MKRSIDLEIIKKPNSITYEKQDGKNQSLTSSSGKKKQIQEN